MTSETAAVQREFIPFGGALTRKQFSLAQRMLLPWWRSMHAISVCIVLTALVFDLGVPGAVHTPLWKLFLSLLWAAAWVLFSWVLSAFVRYSQWRAIQATQREITGCVGVAGIEWNTPITTSKLPWSQIVKIRQRPEMLLLFYSANCAFYIPKRFFSSDAAWSEANALALRAVPARKKRSRLLKVLAGIAMAFVALIAIAFACLSGLSFYVWPTDINDHKLSVTPEVIERLRSLQAERKFGPDRLTFYPGAMDEEQRLRAQAAVDSTIESLVKNLPAHPQRSTVLSTMKTTLSNFDTPESEERDQILVYLNRVNQICGVQGSSELFNVWRSGFPYGWFL